MEGQCHENLLAVGTKQSAILNFISPGLISVSINTLKEITMKLPEGIIAKHIGRRFVWPGPRHCVLSGGEDVLDVGILSGQTNHKRGRSYNQIDQFISHGRPDRIVWPLGELRLATHKIVAIYLWISGGEHRTTMKFQEAGAARAATPAPPVHHP